MTTYQEKDLENLMCSPGPAVPFNGGYGANPTSQAPYAIYDTAAMYYPNHYQSNPYAVQQDHLQIPWSSAEPVSSMQWSPQQLQNTPDINSNYNSCVFDNTQYLQTSFMTQTTPVLSSNSSFMTPSRKVLISRPAKCSWDFSTSHLHSMVMCCIARKINNDGVLSTFGCQIENIENPRIANGNFEGYAILTFKDPKAAAFTVEALNSEGYFIAGTTFEEDQLNSEITFAEDVLNSECDFLAKPDIYQSSASPTQGHFITKPEKCPLLAPPGVQKVRSWKINIEKIPEWFVPETFRQLIEDLMPSYFATIDTYGRSVYDSLKNIDLVMRKIPAGKKPTRRRYKCQGSATVTFHSELVASKMVEILQRRGFTADLVIHGHKQSPLPLPSRGHPSAPSSGSNDNSPRGPPPAPPPSPRDLNANAVRIQSRGGPPPTALKPKKVVRIKAKARRGPPSKDPKGRGKAIEQLPLQEKVEFVDLISPPPSILDLSDFEPRLVRNVDGPSSFPAPCLNEWDLIRELTGEYTMKIEGGASEADMGLYHTGSA